MSDNQIRMFYILLDVAEDMVSFCQLKSLHIQKCFPASSILRPSIISMISSGPIRIPPLPQATRLHPYNSFPGQHPENDTISNKYRMVLAASICTRSVKPFKDSDPKRRA